ncbi:MAG: endonuclease domain-containing protein [Lentimicrobiaceae bacterium]|nr:endonuclease domain-containing protein [Lentimicrobiaceae bacterium]
MRRLENHYFGASLEIVARARQLRKSLTPSEKILWQALRKKQVAGMRFRRQHPIAQFIVDFYCHQVGLIIEIDGEIHLERDQMERDENRTHALEHFGLQVLRFRNEQIKQDLDNVLNRIREEIDAYQ